MTAHAPFPEAEDRRPKAEGVTKMLGVRSSRKYLQPSAYSLQPEVNA